MTTILSDNEVKRLVEKFIKLCYEGEPIPVEFKRKFNNVEECLNFLDGQDFLVDGGDDDYAIYCNNGFTLTEEQKTYILERFNEEYEKYIQYNKFLNDVKILAGTYGIDKDTLPWLLEELY